MVPTLSEYRYAEASSTTLVLQLVDVLLFGVAMRLFEPCSGDRCCDADKHCGSEAPRTGGWLVGRERDVDAAKPATYDVTGDDRADDAARCV